MVVSAFCGHNIIDMGCDWLTCTTNNQKDTEKCRSEVVAVMDSERHLGNDVVPWGMAGFEGLACGQVRFGFRGDECLVILSGNLAQREWRRFHEVAANVSRLDLQVTACSNSSARDVVTQCLARARKFKQTYNHRRTITERNSDNGELTIYFGKRKSDYYGRIYCKGLMRDSGYPLEAVRAEVEIKGKPAKKTYEGLVVSKHALITAGSIVSTWFGRVGLPIQDLPDTFDLYQGFVGASDNVRRLKWLRNQVRPSIAILKDSGMLTDALDALGLADDVCVLQSDENGEQRR